MRKPLKACAPYRWFRSAGTAKRRRAAKPLSVISGTLSSVCIVIVNYNGAAYVESSIASALAQRYDGEVRVVVVDNRSTDDSLRVLRGIGSIEVISNASNAGFGAAANLAAFASKAEFIAFLNPDAVADPNWLETIVPWMCERRVDFASSVIRAGSDVYFGSGRFIPELGTTLVARGAGKTDWLSGCALVARSSAFRSIRGFDERFFLYCEDVDLSLRARAAHFAVCVLPRSLVDHPRHGMSTNGLGRRKAEVAYASRGRLIAKHVPGRWHVPALAFTATLSPLRNGVRPVDLLRVARAVVKGYSDGRAARRSDERPKRRPKIGVLANIYESGAGIRAGGHRHFIEVVRRWTEADIVVFAPLIARADIARELPEAAFEALPSLAARDGSKAVDFLYRALAAVLRLRALRRCDAFLATSHLLPDVLPPIFARRPMMVVCHHLITSEPDSLRRAGLASVLGERLSLLTIRWAARAVVSSSQIVIDELRSRNFRMPAAVSTNGVDHLHFPPAIDVGSEQRSGVVTVGRLHPAKSLEDALRAWSIVVRAFPYERFTIIGAADTDEYERSLKRLAEELGLLHSVRFVGGVDDGDKLNALSHAKVFLFPSRQEGWGIALAEAMRAGTPCVTYDLPIFAEIFPGGRLEAALGDFTGLAARVVTLLRDESTRVALAREAFALGSSFTWERASTIERAALAPLLRCRGRS